MEFTLRSFPKAILHIDGDSFFASCEVARNPSLRGRPVVTGQERGIASSMTYEAKRLGVTRGMKIHDIKKVCPEAVILPSDYETYGLYSQRMYDIVRKFTPAIDEYSIDECFADLTGLRRSLRMPYSEMARRIKHELDSSLGITFSVGLSVNKVLSKVASKWKKPSGLTIIPGREITQFLKDLPVGKVWGIGPNTSNFLGKFGISTALDFALRSEEWVEGNLSKPFQEIWRELRGEFCFPLTFGEKHDYQSISKTRTFTPPSSDRDFVFSQLSKNIENACIKMRRHGLYTREFFFYLKTQDFHHLGFEIKLQNSVCIPEVIIKSVGEQFERVYRKGVLYRATGIVLMKLHSVDTQTLDLFGKLDKIQNITRVYDAVDRVAERYGKHTIFLGSSFIAMKQEQHKGERGFPTDRRKPLLLGETLRKHVNLPLLGSVK